MFSRIFFKRQDSPKGRNLQNRMSLPRRKQAIGNKASPRNRSSCEKTIQGSFLPCRLPYRLLSSLAAYFPAKTSRIHRRRYSEGQIFAAVHQRLNCYDNNSIPDLLCTCKIIQKALKTLRGNMLHNDDMGKIPSEPFILVCRQIVFIDYILRRTLEIYGI